jgi:uncharacterized protein
LNRKLSFSVGCLAELSLLVLAFVWGSLCHRRALVDLRWSLRCTLLRPIFGSWSVLQLAVISIIAGFSEEAFFRGAIQGSLAARVGVPVALLLASLLFAALHLITWTYAMIVAFIGAYLGLLLIWTGNLLTPIVAHAVYDFVALVYFLRLYRAT